MLVCYIREPFAEENMDQPNQITLVFKESLAAVG
jgi:hypothetical protein